MWLAKTIRVLHLAFVAFVVLAPFSPTPHLWFVHMTVVPSLLVHWLLNSDECALTMLEMRVRGVSKSTSFMGQLVGPVYSPPSSVYYIASMFLLWVSSSRFNNFWRAEVGTWRPDVLASALVRYPLYPPK